MSCTPASPLLWAWWSMTTRPPARSGSGRLTAATVIGGSPRVLLVRVPIRVRLARRLRVLGQGVHMSVGRPGPLQQRLDVLGGLGHDVGDECDRRGVLQTGAATD